jgi:hypothetical protein
MQNNITFFAEVLYYFQTHTKFIEIGLEECRDPQVQHRAFAMVSLFLDLDLQYLQGTYNVVCLCHHEPDIALAVFLVQAICAVVAALPWEHLENYWYILEELRLDVSVWTGSNTSTGNDVDGQSDQEEGGEMEEPADPHDFDGFDSNGFNNVE